MTLGFKAEKLIIKACSLISIVFFISAFCGCSAGSPTTEEGVVLGSAAGAGLGAVVGHQVGHAGEGAAVGATAGAVTGAIMGKSYESRAKELEAQEEMLKRQELEMERQKREIEDIKRQKYYNDALKKYEKHPTRKEHEGGNDFKY
ncbi:MAG: hypothetical protein D6719_10080 [Candidatus Dadabacteria bacterium]|nr:MAG: hypothetical protein D6719_10080 [Candidatus Dadabacteria bacterium]